MSVSPFLGSNVVPSIIDNKPVTSTGKTYDVIRTDDPKGQQVLHKVACVDVKGAHQALAAAKKAFPGWKNTDINARRTIINKAAELLKDPARLGKYSELTVEETGLSKNWSMYDSE